MKTKKMSKMSLGKKVAIGAGVAAAAAGAYYLLGPNAKAHQKKASALFSKMKKEVQSKIKKGEEMTVDLYHKVVDTIAENYSKQYKLHEKDIKAFAERLKNEYKKIVKK